MQAIIRRQLSGNGRVDGMVDESAQSNLESERRRPSRQRMHSSAACASYVQCPLQTSPVTQPPVGLRYINTTASSVVTRNCYAERQILLYKPDIFATNFGLIPSEKINTAVYIHCMYIGLQ